MRGLNRVSAGGGNQLRSQNVTRRRPPDGNVPLGDSDRSACEFLGAGQALLEWEEEILARARGGKII